MLFIRLCILIIILMSMLTEPYKIFHDKSIKKRRMKLPGMRSKHKSVPYEKKYHVLICPCHLKNFRKLSRRESKHLPVNSFNYAYHKANVVRDVPLVKRLSQNDMVKPLVSYDGQKMDDDWETNSKDDPASLFNYLKSQHGDEFLEKLKSNLKDRGIDFHPPGHKKAKLPEYDLKKDEASGLLKYRKWPIIQPVENFHTDFITQDSSYEAANSDVSENSASLKTTEKLKPVSNSSKKAAMNESVADSINRRIDKEILPALAAISQQLNELKEKEYNRSLEGKNSIEGKNYIDGKTSTEGKNNSNPEGFPCRLDGNWVSDLYGVKLSITTLKNMSLNVKVNSSGKSTSGVIDNKWTIEGFTLAKFGGPFALIGIYPEKRGLVSFVGQCRVCKDEEAIFGLWSVCNFKTEKSESLINIESKADVMKKDKTGPVQKGAKLEDEDLLEKINRRDVKNNFNGFKKF